MKGDDDGGDACVCVECGLVCDVDWVGQTKEEEEAHEGLLLMMMLGRKTNRQGKAGSRTIPSQSQV
jgi:hypothetical protein